MTARTLDTTTLAEAAKYLGGLYLLNSGKRNRDWVMGQFYNFTYKDEHAHLMEAIRGELGANALRDFDAQAAKILTPRDDKVFHDLLANKLAITPSGEHIEGKIGTCQVGKRHMGRHIIEVESQASIRYRKKMGIAKEHRILEHRMANHRWPIYAGETEERLIGSKVPDLLPDGTPGMPVGAFNTTLANVIAVDMADACVDRLDEGSVGGVVQGYDGAQGTNPDIAPVGNLLFSLLLAATAFGAAVDGAPGGLATAAAIGDDISADFTATLTFCRAASSNVQPTPLDDLIDGEAGTTGADFNWNTLAIVAGATIEMTGWTMTMPES